MSDDQAPADGIVDARLAQAKARFGDRFDDAQWTEIRKQIAHAVEQANRLRAVPMGNADEPEIVFVPFRRDAPPPPTGGSLPYRTDDPAWGAK